MQRTLAMSDRESVLRLSASATMKARAVISAMKTGSVVSVAPRQLPSVWNALSQAFANKIGAEGELSERVDNVRV